MLHSVLLKLKGLDPYLPDTGAGIQLRGLFYSIIRKDAADARSGVEPRSSQLHRSPNRKPFTVSLLRTSSTFTARFTFLDDALFDVFRRYCPIPGEPDAQVVLGSARHTVEEVLWSRATIPQLVASVRPAGHILLAFHSETAFKLPASSETGTRRFCLFPDPVRIFESLVAPWEAVCALGGLDLVTLDTDLLDRVANVCWVERHALEIRRFTVEGRSQSGFIGTCSIRIESRDQALRQQLQALALFAAYAGVGTETTMGMGQCEYLGPGPQHRPAYSPLQFGRVAVTT